MVLENQLFSPSPRQTDQEGSGEFSSIQGREIEVGIRKNWPRTDYPKQKINYQAKLTVERTGQLWTFSPIAWSTEGEDWEKVEKLWTYLELTNLKTATLIACLVWTVATCLYRYGMAQDTDFILLDEPLNSFQY